MHVYLDNAASTAPLPEVLETMLSALRDLPGNPSSLHAVGAKAARALVQAREDIASLLHGAPEEIVFCGSGTEANALALLGAADLLRNKHLVTTSMEHASLFENAHRLKGQGWDVTFVCPNRDGTLDTEALLGALRENTSLMALSLVNNEIGTLVPIVEIARAVHRRLPRLHLHVDAVQFAGLLPLDVHRLGANSVSISGHKLHGPKGVGALWVKKGSRISPLYNGGGQEYGMRSGTENVPACMGFAVAARAARSLGESALAVEALRDRLEDLVLALVPAAQPTVPRKSPRAPHIASILLPGIPAEPVLHALESRDVFASEGAACSTRKKEQSRVLRQLGVPATTGSIRFSLSRFTTMEEVEFAAQAFASSVQEIVNVVKATR